MMDVWQAVMAVSIALVMAAHGRRKRSLDNPGAVAAFVVGVVSIAPILLHPTSPTHARTYTRAWVNTLHSNYTHIAHALQVGFSASTRMGLILIAFYQSGSRCSC